MPSLVTAMPMTICGRSSRESLDLPQVRNPAWLALHGLFPAVSGVIAGQALAACVAGDGLVLVLGLEIGGRGVEEQQVHLQIQQVGDLVKYLPLQGAGLSSR